MDHKQLAADILEKVGGKENVINATHCMTRLRLELRDDNNADLDALKKVKGVIQVVKVGSQTQVVIGQGVDQVYDDFCKITQLTKSAAIDENLDKPKGKLSFKDALNNILASVSGSITPVLPAFIVAGIFKMIAVLLGPKNLGVLAETSSLYVLCNLVNDGVYYFLPFMVAYSASKKFGANPVYAMIIMAVSLHPNWIAMVAEKTPFAIYGLPVKMINYTQAVLPVIMIVYILSIVEKWVKKIMPKLLRTIGLPVLTIAIMLPLAYCVFGPLCNIIMGYVASAIIWLNNNIGTFAIVVVAAVWTLVITFGMHVPVMMALLPVWMEMGYDAIVSPAGIAGGFANFGVELAYALRADSEENRSLGWSCLVTNFTANIGEPYIYGIYLRDKKAFVWHTLGAMAGAAVMGILGAKVTMFSGVGFPILNFLRFGEYAVGGIIGMAASFIVSLALGMVFGFEKSSENN